MLIKRLANGLTVLIIAILAGSSLNPAAAQATPNYIEGTDAAALIYNPIQVNKISLRMSDSDFNSLHWPNVTWDNEGDWLETQMNFTMGTKTYGPYKVGVHLKGAWGSWRDVTGKAAFKIKMDAFVKNQNFFGITKMTLNNMVQDGSYIHEVLAYKLFREVGVPAPRTGFADVSLNGINYGLHLNVETVNPEMLKRWNISSSQMVKGAVPTFPDFWPGSEGAYAIESGITDSYPSLTALIAANQLDASAWWTRINQIADMNEMTLEWATELYTGHWDGYVLNKNNYFVNFDDEGKATMLPWGTDQTWNGSYNFFGSSALMVNKCWGSIECTEMYYQALAKVANTAKRLNLTNMATNVSTAVQNAISQDPFGPGLGSAQGAQGNTVWQLGSQLEILTSMAEPWDTSLSQITANGVPFSPEKLIYLAPGTKSVRLNPITTQSGALAQVQPMGLFKAGLNSGFVKVTSADGLHIAIQKINFYVYTQRSATAKLPFTKASMTDAGKQAANQLAAKFQNSDSMILTLSINKNQPKASILLSQRTAVLIAILKAQGVTPMKVVKTLTTAGNINTLSVSASYRN